MRFAAALVVLAGCRIHFDELTDGEVPGGLVSRGVVARYFLDDDTSGGLPALAHDDIAPSTDLTMVYAPDPTWISRPTGQGLSFGGSAFDGRGCAPTTGKVHDAFDGGTVGTLEAVVKLDLGTTAGSPLAHIGEDQSWAFTLGYSSLPTPHVWFGAETTDPRSLTESRRFAIELGSPRGRTVLTLVYDTDAQQSEDRARLFVDGVELAIDPAATTDSYVPSEAFVIQPNASICIGNTALGNRTPIGQILYAAFYNVAFTDDEIARSVARLQSSDDH